MYMAADGGDWKASLTKPKQDTRKQTEDVTATKGTDFEDYYPRAPAGRRVY
eukprot:gene11846-6652_t